MGTIYQILQLILCLSILVTLHELGHYFTAKWFKMRIEKFFLFFDWPTKIYSKKIKDTEWGIGILPLGGYVKIAGMIDESMDKEQMKQAPQPWEFRSKPAWQRLIVMLGGVTVNFFLAWFIYACVFTYYGDKYIKKDDFQKNGLYFSNNWKKAGFKDGDKIINVDGKAQNNLERQIIDILLGEKVTVKRNDVTENINLTDEKIKLILNGFQGGLPFYPVGTVMKADSIFPNSLALNAGFKKGDIILAIDNVAKHSNLDIIHAIQSKKNDSIKITIKRNSDTLVLASKLGNEGKLGFSFSAIDKKDFLTTDKYSFFNAIPKAFNETIEKLVYQIKQFKLIIRPQTEAYKQVKGPIGIVKIFDPHWNWELFWKFTAMFSIWLAFVNLLPIPGLDGGHALFTTFEMITGKTINDKTMGIVQTIGMIILLTLMVLIFGHDIYMLIQDTF